MCFSRGNIGFIPTAALASLRRVPGMFHPRESHHSTTQSCAKTGTEATSTSGVGLGRNRPQKGLGCGELG